MQNEQYLEHFGIKGQRWGVRRFQNEDGTLTSEGKMRYLKPDGQLTNAGKNKFKNNVQNVKSADLLDQIARYNHSDNSKKRNNNETAHLIDQYRKELSETKSGLKAQKVKLVPEEVGSKTKFDDKKYERRLNLTDRAKKEMPNYEKLIDKIAGSTLRDLGYKDSKKARNYIRKAAHLEWIYDP